MEREGIRRYKKYFEMKKGVGESGQAMEGWKDSSDSSTFESFVGLIRTCQIIIGNLLKRISK